ncbi:hypothetical protein CWB68_20600, partial [Pseudoalteromonas sp. S979]
MITSSFTPQDGLFIYANLPPFITQPLCTKTTAAETSLALATLVDEFGCKCRKTTHQRDDILEEDTLLHAY